MSELIAWEDSVVIVIPGHATNRGIGHVFIGPPGAGQALWSYDVDITPIGSFREEWPLNRWLLKLRVERRPEQKEVEDALPKPEQEGALKGPVGETVPCDPGIGGLGPLPDTGPNEAEVVEGVRSEAEDKAWKLAFDLGAMLSEVRGVLDDLQIASSKAIDDCGITKGQLCVRREGLIATVSWGFDGATLDVAAKVETEEED